MCIIGLPRFSVYGLFNGPFGGFLANRENNLQNISLSMTVRLHCWVVDTPKLRLYEPFNHPTLLLKTSRLS